MEYEKTENGFRVKFDEELTGREVESVLEETANVTDWVVELENQFAEHPDSRYPMRYFAKVDRGIRGTSAYVIDAKELIPVQEGRRGRDRHAGLPEPGMYDSIEFEDDSYATNWPRVVQGWARISSDPFRGTSVESPISTKPKETDMPKEYVEDFVADLEQGYQAVVSQEPDGFEEYRPAPA